MTKKAQGHVGPAPENSKERGNLSLLAEKREIREVHEKRKSVTMMHDVAVEKKITKRISYEIEGN